MASTHDIGDQVRIYSTFTTTATGQAVDPSTVTLVVKPPVGSSTTYTYPATVDKTATGAYEKVIEPATAGTYRYRWTSTGTGAGSEEGWFQVRSRKV